MLIISDLMKYHQKSPLTPPTPPPHGLGPGRDPGGARPGQGPAGPGPAGTGAWGGWGGGGLRDFYGILVKSINIFNMIIFSI